MAHSFRADDALMDRTLTHFIAALRNAEVRISPAETLDAMNTLSWLATAIATS